MNAFVLQQVDVNQANVERAAQDANKWQVTAKQCQAFQNNLKIEY